MTVLKCKMCGGALEIIENNSVVKCDYCGSKQTLPPIDNERKIQLFERANFYRAKSEFDKAGALYENILIEEPNEAEAYWGICLCRYGIEYVVDPVSQKRIPTCHRAQYTSILEDKDYLSAIENADLLAKEVYIKEAEYIDKVQKGILEISSKEKSFDIFICYKETDENGNRTLDSVEAQKLYKELTKEGYKVFFARITLEDKIGTAYEPYIFAALNSAKIMIVLGTKPEHFNAVWVKNEWSRFLSLINQGQGKTIIPCYKDMAAEELPDELSYLQAQDMNKIGAIQDLVRGVEKIVGNSTEQAKTEEQSKNSQQTSGSNVEALLTRGNIALEDGAFEEAKAFFNEALNINAKCAEAYFGLAMSEEKLKSINDLIKNRRTNNKNYRHAKDFSDVALLENLNKLEKEIYVQKKSKYEEASELCNIISAGFLCTFGLRSDGTIVASYRDTSFCQIEVSSWTDIVAVSTGNLFTVGLKKNGAVMAVGSNSYGQCDVGEWADIVAVSAGEYHTVGLKSDGTVMAVGSNGYGQCDVGKWTDIVAVSAGKHHTVGLKNDGTVVAVGDNELWQCEVSNWTDIVAVSAGHSYTVGLKSDGTVVAVGNNENDQCETERWTDIIAVSAGESHTVGLKSDGTVVATEYAGDIEDYDGQCDVDRWKNIVAVSAGYNHTVGLKNDGTVVAVGDYEKNSWNKFYWTDIIVGNGELKHYNCDDRLNVKSWRLFDSLNDLENERVIKMAEAAEERKRLIEKKTKLKDSIDKTKKLNRIISAGIDSTIGLKNDGTIVTTLMAMQNKHEKDDFFIRNTVSTWMNIIAISTANSVVLGLKKDGTVVSVGCNDYGQCNTKKWFGIVEISAGTYHSVGLKKDGTVVAVGNNKNKQCNISNWTAIVEVSAGGYHTIGLKNDGTVKATGDNNRTQCDVGNWMNIVAVSAGGLHTVGLKSYGTVVATGDNSCGQCDVTKWTDIIAISAGEDHTVGLKNDGTVVAAGSNAFGQCDICEWRDIIAISAGNMHTIGLKSNGTVVATKYIGNSKYFRYHGQCDVSGWKLFNNLDNLENERIQKIAQKKAEVRQKQMAEYRLQGLCQHCGGTFKGLFKKKCSNCEKEKDY